MSDPIDILRARHITRSHGIWGGGPAGDLFIELCATTLPHEEPVAPTTAHPTPALVPRGQLMQFAAMIVSWLGMLG